MSTFGTKNHATVPACFWSLFEDCWYCHTFPNQKCGCISILVCRNMKHATATAFWLKIVGCVCCFSSFFLKLPGASWPWPGCSQQPSRSLQQLSWWHPFWRLPGQRAAWVPGSPQRWCHHDNCCNDLEGCWLQPGQGQLAPGSLKNKRRTPTNKTNTFQQKCSSSRMFHVSAYQNANTLAFSKMLIHSHFWFGKVWPYQQCSKIPPPKKNAGTVAVLFQMWTCISTFKAQTQKVCQFHQFGRVNAGKCDS